MAVGLEKFEGKLDRLEKFFRKKRPAARESVVLEPTEITPLTPAMLDPDEITALTLAMNAEAGIPTFPAPSFIKPTKARMVARDEPGQGRRAQSVPDAHKWRRSSRAPRLASSLSTHNKPQTRSKLSQGTVDILPMVPKRSSSLGPRCIEVSLAGLLEYSFSEQSETTKNSEKSETPSPTCMSGSTFETQSRSTSTSISMTPESQPDSKRDSDTPMGGIATLYYQHPDTPPLSAQQETSPVSLLSYHQKELPPIPLQCNPTPDASPRLVPLPDPEHDELVVEQAAEAQWPKSFDLSAAILKEEVPDHESTSNTLSKVDPILREPSLSDFLSLSDDDIADEEEERPTPPPLVSARPVSVPPPSVPLPSAPSSMPNPPSCALPPDPPAIVATPHSFNRNQLIMLSPPLASRLAALEAARIATKYRFDLVYVVNLRPNHMGMGSFPQPRPLSKQSSFSSLATATTLMPASDTSTCSDGTSLVSGNTPRNSGMTGCLWAAYGLPSIMSPFNIKAPVHQKVLQSDGWLQFRSDTGAMDEFATGYLRAFYPGYSPDGRGRSGEPVAEPVSRPEGRPKKRKARAVVNRGVVFAAYRLPAADGSSIPSDEEELEELRRDAEALVDMLIDTHMMQRQRRRTSAARRYAAKAMGVPPVASARVFAF
ncbi:hypothetical protein B0T17DRAFT_590593 [Bombardia bombarda]|uniref:Uncharacterized protein n=1 Tax=Bombardia bombarda TaxID=252184 RepID=A0AA39WZY5_9PEZI|nr:hypothetical protein B0T17DRAFT_590593 [Bombardia bombarda]